MTVKQAILQKIYPITMGLSNLFSSKSETLLNTYNITPQVSFYTLEATDNKGNTIHFSQFKGKKVLVVNTASDCGYTAQYAELEQLNQLYKNKLAIIAFPSNNFKAQEKQDDAHIAQFCQINYGITFLLMKKSTVLKDLSQNKVHEWLSYSIYNGWCNQQPTWNFCKYLINESGVLTHYFPQTIAPLNKVLLQAIEK